MTRALALGAAALAAALAILPGGAGCGGQQKQAGPVARPAPPPYAQVAARFNERTAPLDRLWARTVIRAWYRDKEGREQRDQFEGHLQYLRPDRVLLTFDKVGNTYAALGANQQQYWWLQKEPQRRAYVGAHEHADPGRIAELGLPVHPLSFVDLLAITPLDAAAAGTRVEWSPDGRHLLVTSPGRMGLRRLWLDPADYTPARVELLGTGGEPALGADLTRYQPIAVRGPATGWRPTVATALEATRPSDGLRIRMDLFEPETAGSRPSARNFEFDRVRQLLSVSEAEVVDLDRQASPAANGAAPAAHGATPAAGGSAP